MPLAERLEPVIAGVRRPVLVIVPALVGLVPMMLLGGLGLIVNRWIVPRMGIPELDRGKAEATTSNRWLCRDRGAHPLAGSGVRERRRRHPLVGNHPDALARAGGAAFIAVVWAGARWHLTRR